MQEEISIGTQIVKFGDHIRSAFDVDVISGEKNQKISRRARFLEAKYCLKVLNAYLKLVSSIRYRK